MSDQTPALRMTHVSKSFGGEKALDDVSLAIYAGEVHGLLGENGSGKSTLIKILAGYHTPESGELDVHGEQVKLPLAAGQARSLGIEFVHQDLGLIQSLTVVENLRLEAIAQPEKRWFVSWREERRRARALFEEYGLDLDPAAKVSELQPVEKAFLAIVRAVHGIVEVAGSQDGGRAILVLDEPTAFLSKPDRERLFLLVRQITSAGGAALLVSHDLEEVCGNTDRITVLRDGHGVGTVMSVEATETELVSMIIGRDLQRLDLKSAERPAQSNATIVDGLCGGRVSRASFRVRRGEVLGITGQVGAGFEDVPYLVFGAARSEEGSLTVGEDKYALQAMTPAKAISAGIALIPADRQSDGSIGSLPAIDNVMLQVMDRYFTRGVLARRRMAHDAARLFEQFDVRPADPKLTYSAFSGGNQQKALLAKWMQSEPRLLLIHEPTIGVDIGARETIFRLMREAAGAGGCIVCASVDHEQLATICDRVLIFARGQIVDELTGSDISKERITERCYDLAQSASSEIGSVYQDGEGSL